MAKGYLGIELTSAKLRYVFLTRKGKDLQLEKAGTFIFKVDPTIDSALTHMLTNILKRENIAPEKIFVSLSRADVLARELILPPMKADELEEVIVSEIEKIPTFSENSFDYIYHKFEISKEKSNVVFSAINRKLLSYILNEVQNVKIPFLNFEISPLNLPQIVNSVIPFKPNQAFLLINDMVSHLVLYTDKKYKLFYKTTSGTNHLVTNNVVNEKTVSAFAGEIQRVLKAYLNEHKDEKVEDLLMLWDTSTSAVLGDELQKHVDLKIQQCRLRDFFIINDGEAKEEKETDPLDNPAYLFGGGGIYAEKNKVKVHFPLDHFFRDFHLKKCIIQAGVLSLIFIIISGFFIGKLSYGFYRKKVKAKKAIENVQWEKEDLQNATRELYRKRDEYLTVRQGLLDQATYLKVINRIYWTDVLGVVAENMPKQSSLVYFFLKEDGKVVFKGESMNIESVSEMIRKIDSSELLTDGRFDYLTEKIVDGKKIFTFGILAQLKQMTIAEIETQDKEKEETKK